MKHLLPACIFSGILVLSLTGCGSKEVTGLSLDQNALELAMETSVTISATLEPAKAEGEILWTSSNPAVATVEDGVVTAMKRGSTLVKATSGSFSDSCEVTVTSIEFDPDNLPASLKGSNYHLIQIDDSSYNYIKDKVVNDFRPNNAERNLWVWDGTFVGGTPSGPNFYGQEKGWVSLVVANKGWSGAGYNVSTDYGAIDMTDLFNNPGAYFFHIGLKSAQSGTAVMFILTDGPNEAKFVIGNAPVDGIQPYTDFIRDNQWNSIEIPVTYLNALGVFFNNTFSNVNIMSFLAGGVQGTTLDMDAVFFYKKTE